MSDAIGWASSALLLVTLLIQIRAQWRARHTESVSPWLFVGQLGANLGFVVYSVQVDSAVFIVTNTALAMVAVTGLATLLLHRRRERARAR
jgi:uncharacterized protein with PQ loop repeat